jgi:hypothetical protein
MRIQVTPHQVDEYRMAVELRPGSPVVLVERNGATSAMREATFVSGRGSAVAVRLNDDCPFAPGATVLLVTGPMGNRWVTSARIAAVRGGALALHLGQFDPRSNPRYPTELRCEVRSVLGGSRQQGTVLDVSLGGLCVAVPAKPGGREVEIQVDSGGFAARLPCELMGTRADGERTLLNLRFRELTPVQLAFVRNLVASLQRAFEAAQARLAS